MTNDIVNKLKTHMWDDKSTFDAEKDKTKFRRYEEACDRVKAFYKEQHGELVIKKSYRNEADSTV